MLQKFEMILSASFNHVNQMLKIPNGLTIEIKNLNSFKHGQEIHIKLKTTKIIIKLKRKLSHTLPEIVPQDPYNTNTIQLK